MIPKFRAWYKKGTLPMLKVNLISFDQQFTDVYIDDEAVAETEMSLDFDEVILMQSTGLFDKNGKEIFESDVVSWIDNGILLFGVVEFTKGMFLVNGNEPISAEVEIIGNIYQHPDLVEED